VRDQQRERSSTARQARSPKTTRCRRRFLTASRTYHAARCLKQASRGRSLAAVRFKERTSGPESSPPPAARALPRQHNPASGHWRRPPRTARTAATVVGMRRPRYGSPKRLQPATKVAGTVIKFALEQDSRAGPNPLRRARADIDNAAFRASFERSRVACYLTLKPCRHFSA